MEPSEPVLWLCERDCAHIDKLSVTAKVCQALQQIGWLRTWCNEAERRKKGTKWREGHMSCREEWGGTARSMTNCVAKRSTRRALQVQQYMLSDINRFYCCCCNGLAYLLADDEWRTPIYLAAWVLWNCWRTKKYSPCSAVAFISLAQSWIRRLYLV